jgi:branched-chain amino acid transport system substrate-binding protein
MRRIKIMKKRFLAVVVLMLVLSLMVGCGQSNANGGSTDNASDAVTDQSTVKIGVLLPMSGSTSYYGKVQLGGIQLYADYINENGGIKSLDGAKIELVVADSASNPETGKAEFERLIEANVSAVIGPYNSTVAAATAPLALQYKIPYVVVNATADNFMGEANKYVYRTNNGSMDVAPLYSQWVEYLNERIDGEFKKVAVVYDTGDWGSAALATWEKLGPQMGFEVVLSEGVKDATDMTTLVNKIKSEDVDLVVCAIFSNDANMLVRDMNQYECDATMLGVGGGFGDVNFIEKLGPMAENCVYTTAWTPAFGDVSGDAEIWNEKFNEEFGFDMTLESSWGWLGMGTLCDAIERAVSTEKENIADELYLTDLDKSHSALLFSIYNGVKFATDGQLNTKLNDGSIRYNNNELLGDTAGFIFVQVQDSAWEIVYPISATGGEDILIYPNE